MTRERKEEVVLIALVVSCALHVGLMLFARPKVMTRIAEGSVRQPVHGPMRVVRDVPRPEPVRIDAVPDLEAAREAPAAASAELPTAEVGVGAVTAEPSAALDAPSVATPAPAPATPVFDASPIRLDSTVSAKVPMAAVEVPAPAVPVRGVPPPGPTLSGGGLVSSGRDADSLFLPSSLDRELKRRPVADPSAAVAKLAAEPAPARAFKPREEFSPKVDEKLVAEEKRAVKELVDVANPAELKPFVNLAATTAETDGWRYFRVMLTPRQSLPIVPKDVVLVIDASGSIGTDRMSSIRGASKRLLRTVTNSDDRFNLVAFRDRFSYAFGTWQECTQASFDRSDAWLNALAAHGRTDVFSTIRSLLTLPRDPQRPLIALVVTDGDANLGVSDTSELLSRFTALNDGLISIYMYGVRSSANRELIDVLTHGNRGESLVFEGFRFRAGSEIATLAERFRDPVLSDLRVLLSADSRAEAYPRRLRNLYRGDTQELVIRTPASVREVSFSLRGLNGGEAYEGFFRVSAAESSVDAAIAARWASERALDAKLR